MIQKLKVTNYLEETIELSLSNPYETGLAIRAIDGLTPVKADVNISDMATGDGGVYNSARAGYRNIVIYLAFLESPTIEAVRKKTYKYFPLKKKVQLDIVTETDVKVIEGYVEANESVIFSDKTGSQISIVCPDPYFKSLSESSKIIAGVIPNFEFPFSNESLTEKLIEFGVINTGRDTSILYEGDGEPGLSITIDILSNVENLTIYSSTTRELIKIDTSKLLELTGFVLIDEDRVVINTEKGSKSAYLIRAGEEINILNTISDDSSWLKLVKGINVFSYMADVGSDYVEVNIKYTSLYEGV